MTDFWANLQYDDSSNVKITDILVPKLQCTEHLICAIK